MCIYECMQCDQCVNTTYQICKIDIVQYEQDNTCDTVDIYNTPKDIYS